MKTLGDYNHDDDHANDDHDDNQNGGIQDLSRCK